MPSAAWLRVFPLRKRLQNRPPSPRRDIDEITRRRTAEAIAIFRRQSDLQKLGLRHRAGGSSWCGTTCHEKLWPAEHGRCLTM